tara:strand:- start:11645 stop:12004 length:360 start_codon:yes stop_codon:yes gene_type:complete
MSILISKELEGHVDIENIFNENNENIYVVFNDKKIICNFSSAAFKKNKISITLLTNINFFNDILSVNSFDIIFNNVLIKNILCKNIKIFKVTENKYKFIFVINKNKYLINNDEVKHVKN